MPDLMLDPVPPFVWPDPRVLDGSHAYVSVIPYDAVIRRAGGLAGVVSGLNLDGARWFGRLVTSKKIRSRLVIVLYPAGPTCSDVLGALNELQARASGRSSDVPEPLVELRLLPLEPPTVSPPNSLCIVDEEGSEPSLITGSSANFGLGRVESAQVNLVFQPDPALLEAWGNWFDWIWEAAVPLTNETAEIPSLVPALGTVEAAQAWYAYLTRCRDARAQAADASEKKVRVDPESGHITVIGADDEKRLSTIEALGVARLDPLAEKIARIFRLGSLASVDKASRIPPLDVPVKPELFGIPSWRRAGAGTRRVEYRFSVLDSRELRSLETKRRAVGDLLSRFSFPLADGVRWMPHRVRPLFERELDRLNKAGKDAFSRILDAGVSTFVQGRRDRVATAVQALWEEHYPGRRAPDSTVDQILKD